MNPQSAAEANAELVWHDVNPALPELDGDHDGVDAINTVRPGLAGPADGP